MTELIKEKNPISNNLALFLCLLLGAINFWLLYPGGFTPDTWDQYNQAIAANYIYHHPPFMAFCWHFMMKLWNNPGTMLLWHLALLWGAVYNFYRTFNHLISKFKFLYFIIPFLPWVLSYSIAIWKDISFVYSYIYVASLLTYITVTEKKPNIFRLGLISVILFYGTAVKFQARFILPVMALWISLIIIKSDSVIKKIITATVIFTVIFSLQESINNYLITDKKTGNRHSWQMVKLYDLAGISYYQDQLLFPQYIMDNPNLTLEKIKESYNNYSINSLWFREDKILNDTTDSVLLNELWQFWFETVLKYPKSYLKHRLLLWKNIVNAENSAPSNAIGQLAPEGYNEESRQTAFTLKYISKGQFLTKAQYYIWFIPLYIALGFVILRKNINKLGISLIFMNLSALCMVLVFIPLSMACDARYLFIVSIMVTFSHPMVLVSIGDLFKKATKV
ncbi:MULTISPECIES: hypothetical protein [unclassified Rickettsia]|uniref:hypothetical protein n=1 Tax=unclassified Rickettsia TaxID=114295 RepID=UPI003132B6EA